MTLTRLTYQFFAVGELDVSDEEVVVVVEDVDVSDEVDSSNRS
jgi:hypothetical protein